MLTHQQLSLICVLFGLATILVGVVGILMTRFD